MWSISSKGLDRDFRESSRLLKNAHLLRFPHPSPCQARGRLVAAYNGRERFETVPYIRIWGGPVNGISQIRLASVCLREAPFVGRRQGHF